MKNFTLKVPFIFSTFYLIFILSGHKVLSQCSGSTKEIEVNIFLTSKRKLLADQKFIIKRDPSRECKSGEKITIQDGDQIICKRGRKIDMRVTLCNISKLNRINLYLNDYRSNENECRFDSALKSLNGRVGSGEKTYVIYSENEWTISNSDGSFSRYFKKFNLTENQVKVSIREMQDSENLKNFKSNYFANSSQDLTLFIDHNRDPEDKDDSDLTIDVFIDDDGIVKQPK